MASRSERVARVRRELQEAKTRGGFLPNDNPYRTAPRWAPYWLAVLIHGIVAPKADTPRRKRRRNF